MMRLGTDPSARLWLILVSLKQNHEEKAFEWMKEELELMKSLLESEREVLGEFELEIRTLLERG